MAPLVAELFPALTQRGLEREDHGVAAAAVVQRRHIRQHEVWALAAEHALGLMGNSAVAQPLLDVRLQRG
ncbi:hypothetical protein MASR1M8_05420 [Thermomonas brevis]